MFRCAAGSKGWRWRARWFRRAEGVIAFHVHSRIWRKLRIDAGAAVEVALIIEREAARDGGSADLAAGLADEPRALGAVSGPYACRFGGRSSFF